MIRKAKGWVVFSALALAGCSGGEQHDPFVLNCTASRGFAMMAYYGREEGHSATKLQRAFRNGGLGNDADYVVEIVYAAPAGEPAKQTIDRVSRACIGEGWDGIQELTNE